jgi:hypothetical protein
MQDQNAGDVYRRARTQPADEIPRLRGVGNVEGGDYRRQAVAPSARSS